MYLLAGFVSLKLSQGFDVQVDFNRGFVAAPETFEIVKTQGNNNVNKEALKKIARNVQPGPDYIKELTSKIEFYLRLKESKLVKSEFK